MKKILIFNINGLSTKGMSHVPFQYLRISSSVFGKLILSGTASTPVILKTRLGCDFCHIRHFVTCFTIDKNTEYYGFLPFTVCWNLSDNSNNAELTKNHFYSLVITPFWWNVQRANQRASFLDDVITIMSHWIKFFVLWKEWIVTNWQPTIFEISGK